MNERCAFRAGREFQMFATGSKLTTSVVVNGVTNGFPPPIDQSWLWAIALPATFFAVGMFCRCVHVSVAML